MNRLFLQRLNLFVSEDCRLLDTRQRVKFTCSSQPDREEEGREEVTEKACSDGDLCYLFFPVGISFPHFLQARIPQANPKKESRLTPPPSAGTEGSSIFSGITASLTSSKPVKAESLTSLIPVWYWFGLLLAYKSILTLYRTCNNILNLITTF